MDDLENNVKRVYGEYPKGFLEAGHSTVMTRLIQLEERWREAEEREADNLTKPQTTTTKTAATTNAALTDLVGKGQLTEAIEAALAQNGASKETTTALVLLQSRLSNLKTEKAAGTLDNGAYTARLNELTKAFLSILGELEN